MGRDLILVAVSLFAWGVGEGMFTFFQSIYLADWGADPIAIGVIFSVMGICMAVAQIPAGFLADRIGRRPMMWASWFIGAFSAWVMALAPNLAWFTVGFIVYGVTGFVLAPMNSYIADARGKLSVGRALTFTSAAFNLGAVIGPWIGGQIGEAMGLRTVYTVSAVVFIVSTLIVLFIRPQPVYPRAEETASPWGLFRDPRFLGFLALSSLVITAIYLPQPLSSNFLQSERGLSLASIGELGAVYSLGSALISLAIGRLNAGLGFILGQVLVGGFCLSLWQGSEAVWYTLGYFCLGGYRLCRSMMLALSRPLIHSANLGLAFGMIETVNSLAMVLAPLAAGLVYSREPVLVYPVNLILLGGSLAFSLFYLLRNRSVLLPNLEGG